MEKIIEDLNNKFKESAVMNKVMSITSKYTSITKDDMLGDSRKYFVKLARMVSSNILLNEYKIKKNIVAKFHNKDRTSMYHYQKVHNEQYVYWRDYREIYNLVHKDVTKGAKFKDISRNEVRMLLTKYNISDDNYPTHKITCRIGNKKFYINCKYETLFFKLSLINTTFEKFKTSVTYKPL